MHVAPFDFAAFAFFVFEQVGFVADVGQELLDEAAGGLALGAALVALHKGGELAQGFAAGGWEPG